MVCPFGRRRCPYRTNKKWQPNNVCYWFFIKKCTEEHRMYEQPPVPTLRTGETDKEYNIKW